MHGAAGAPAHAWRDVIRVRRYFAAYEPTREFLSRNYFPEVSPPLRRLAPRMPGPSAPQRPWSCDSCRRRYIPPELCANVPPEPRLNIPPELRPNAGLGRYGPRVARRHRGTPAAKTAGPGARGKGPGSDVHQGNLARLGTRDARTKSSGARGAGHRCLTMGSDGSGDVHAEGAV